MAPESRIIAAELFLILRKTDEPVSPFLWGGREGRKIVTEGINWLAAWSGFRRRRAFRVPNLVRYPALAYRVAVPQNRADFGGESGGGGESIRGIGRKRVSFESWNPAERQNRPVPSPREPPALRIRLDLEIRGGRV